MVSYLSGVQIMIDKAFKLITTTLRILAGLWLSFMGAIACLMLFNEIFDPEWGRQAKQTFPDAPEWYILAIVAIAAMACFYITYRLLRPRKSNRVKRTSSYTENG
jgi:drug/metabolite transporter (DMT)-like permease